MGLNLSCADKACFAELCWTPATLEQAEARVHRMGQQASHVNVYYLLGGGTLRSIQRRELWPCPPAEESRCATDQICAARLCPSSTLNVLLRR